MASIFDRISTLVRSNINAILDQAEDPEKVLDQIIRDMQSAIADARSQVAEMIARERLLKSNVEESRDLVQEWDRKAELALNRGMDDLAKEALRRKLDYQKSVQLAEQQWQSQEEVVERLKGDLSTLQSKYENAVRQRDQLIARHKAAQAQEQVNRTLQQFSSIDPSSELARMEDRIKLREAKAQAMTEIREVDMEDQFAKLETDGELEDEFAKLKARVRPEIAAPKPDTTKQGQ